jgi:high-affinity nickel-transport protein
VRQCLVGLGVDACRCHILEPGWFMNFAYSWAFDKPVGKLYYNLVITGSSIAAAFLIGTVEVLGVLTSKMHLRGAAWDFLAGFSINRAGLAIAVLFAVTWASAIAVWRVGGLGRQIDDGSRAR